MSMTNFSLKDCIITEDSYITSLESDNNSEILSDETKDKIISLLENIDVYDNKKSNKCIPDYKFPEIRWDENITCENPDLMSDEEIKNKFQLLTAESKNRKREVCHKCYQTGKRGIAFDIPYFYKGGENWDINIPKNGRDGELGCKGCAWYDFAEWRINLLKELK